VRKKIIDLIFLTFYFIPFRVLLRKVGVKNPTIFTGKAPLNGYAYFTGEIGDKKVFIKFDTKYHLITNDILAYKKCKKKLGEYLVKVIAFKNTGTIQYVIYDYFDGTTLKNNNILENPQLISYVYETISAINSLRLIHRDIKLDNFLIKNEELKIIDLTLMASLDDSNLFKSFNLDNKDEAIILHTLNKSHSPPGLIWNDFYSLHLILKEIIINNNKVIEEETKTYLDGWVTRVEKDIQFNYYKLLLNKSD
jgi:serine/threonine protein kinase